MLNVVYDVSHQSGKQDNDYRFEGTYDPDIIPPYLQGNSLSRQHTVQAHYCDPLSGKWTLESGLGYIYRDYNSLSDYYDQDRQEMASQRYEMENTSTTGAAHSSPKGRMRRNTSRKADSSLPRKPTCLSC